MIDIGLADLLKSISPEKWPTLLEEWDSGRVDFLVVLENQDRRRVVPVGPGCETKTLARALSARTDGWNCLAYCASRKTANTLLETRIRKQLEEKNRQAVGPDDVIVSRKRLAQLEQIERDAEDMENQIMVRMSELAEREALLEEIEEARAFEQFQKVREKSS